MSQTHSNEFSNERIQVVLSTRPHCRVEMLVKTTSSLVEKARAEGIKAVNKQITLPGFRKGKAPAEAIARKFPRDVDQETQTALADLTLKEAMALTQVHPLNRSSKITFDIKKIEDSGAEVLLSFETEPVIPHVDPKLCTVTPAPSIEPTQEQIDEAIRQAQFFFAEWKKTEDRPIREGDYLLINLDTVEGEAEERVFTKVRFEVSKERMAEWMQKIVLGAKAGDVVEGISEPDADATEEEKQEFRPKKTRISILEVEEAILPPVDDAFAKKLRVGSVQEMRESIEKMLREQLQQKAHASQREEVLSFLTKTYPFDIPQSLLEAEVDHRKQQRLNDPEFEKQWEAMSNEKRDAFMETLRAESTDAVRLFYLSRQIVRDAKLTITHQEVHNTAVQLMRREGKHHTLSLEAVPHDIQALALSKVILAHAQDYIIQAAQEEKQS